MARQIQEQKEREEECIRMEREERLQTALQEITCIAESPRQKNIQRLSNTVSTSR